ncbi:unnamed protein product [Owenia fusiformis]|uniref:Nocturnin n=1 Tax=Owenia fusiformis TaxID=6347 RepID=A0A8J1TG24_OWEFU|nr:unnamed protein product [Owenia fusiformis]
MVAKEKLSQEKRQYHTKDNMDVINGKSYKPEISPEIDTSIQRSSNSLLEVIKSLLSGKPALLARTFQSVAKPPIGKNGLRLLQWNILAQGLCMGKDNFVRCPLEALDWGTRKLRIVEEILQYDPDVICMQEVDHFGYLENILQSVGFTGTFYPKPDSPALYVENSNGPDGCAIFYRTEKFELVETCTKILMTNDENMTTNQVCVLNKLQHKGNSSDAFWVATTHLKAKSGWNDLRESQGRYLLKYLKEIVGQSPLIVCGDLNAPPTEKVYEAFSSSDLELQSAYKVANGGKQEPLYTTWKIRGGKGDTLEESCRTIDYVWFNNKCQLNAVLNFPSGEEIGVERLPSFKYPSDHLSLVCDFSI